MKDSLPTVPEDEKRREQIDMLLKGLNHKMSDLMVLAQQLADRGRNGNSGHAKPRKARVAKKR